VGDQPTERSAKKYTKPRSGGTSLLSPPRGYLTNSHPVFRGLVAHG
jgi:hypothetical protein